MSMISEQVRELKEIAATMNEQNYRMVANTFYQAADTIEALSAKLSGSINMRMAIKQGIDNCYMIHAFEHPGYEGNRCAGLRTLNGNGEPCETCKKCLNYYGYGVDD